MVKPVGGACNLDCTYCYYKFKPRELYPLEPDPRMSDAVLETFTRKYLQAMPVQCDFNWQGGEPTLAGLEFFRRAMGDLKKIARQIAADDAAGPAQPVSFAPKAAPFPPKTSSVGRNDPCPCGSGGKFKHCCGETP
jgi:hypothetical protein